MKVSRTRLAPTRTQTPSPLLHPAIPEAAGFSSPRGAHICLARGEGLSARIRGPHRMTLAYGCCPSRPASPWRGSWVSLQLRLPEPACQAGLPLAKGRGVEEGLPSSQPTPPRRAGPADWPTLFLFYAGVSTNFNPLP